MLKLAKFWQKIRSPWTCFLPKMTNIWTYLAILGMFNTFLFPQYSLGSFSNQAKAAFIMETDNLYLPEQISEEEFGQLSIVQGNTLMQISSPINPIAKGPLCSVFKKRLVIVTAYTSRPEETDSSPFITASGSHVRDGIVAANFLKFGTKIKFPQLFGNKIFVVEDKLAPKNSHKIDIWMPSYQQAIEFGVKRTEVIIF